MESLRKITLYPFLIVGFLTGALLALLVTHEAHGIFGIFDAKYPASLRTILYLWVGFYGLLFLLAYPTAQSLKKLILITFIPSFLSSLLFYWAFHNTANQFILLFFSSYALNAFHINYQTNDFHFCYHTLFQAVWDTLVKLIIVTFFTLLCWLVVYACNALFEFLDITFIEKLLQKDWLDVWLTAMFMSIGFYISFIVDNVVHSLRAVFLYICRYLFIPLAIVSIIFILAFFILPHQQKFNMRSESIFLFISYASVVFFNGVYQDGSNKNPFPNAFMWICRVFLWITPLFTVLALYSEYYYGYNGIGRVGFNSGNFFDVTTILLLLIYNIAYAIIALNPRINWLDAVQRTNIILAIMVIIVTFIITLPMFTKHLPKQKTNLLQSTASTQAAQSKMKVSTGNWVAVTNGAIPTNGFIAGENNGPMYLCRALINKSERVGVVHNNRCQIAIDDNIMTPSIFSVYVEPSQKTYWSTYYALANGNKRLNVGTADAELSICRTIYDNRVYVGIYDNLRCNFIAKNGVIHSQDKPQYLYVNDTAE